MSWRCSRHLWSLGPIDLHVFSHALDPSRLTVWFWMLGIGLRHEFQLWPLRPRIGPFWANLSGRSYWGHV